MFVAKERLPSLLCANVIYKFTCSGCSATYYGKTSRNLLIRSREHLGINKLGQKVNLMALLPSRKIFAKQDTQHPLIISLYFLKVTILLIYLSMRASSYTGTDLHLTPNSLLFLCPYYNFFSLLLSFLRVSCFPALSIHTHFPASTSPLANFSVAVLIVFPSPLFL